MNSSRRNEKSSSQALVATDKAARYRKQLTAHLGRKTEVVESDDATILLFVDGQCTMACIESGLLLTVSADSARGQKHVEDVIARHLERLSTKDYLSVVWDML